MSGISRMEEEHSRALQVANKMFIGAVDALRHESSTAASEKAQLRHQLTAREAENQALQSSVESLRRELAAANAKTQELARFVQDREQQWKEAVTAHQATLAKYQTLKRYTSELQNFKRSIRSMALSAESPRQQPKSSAEGTRVTATPFRRDGPLAGVQVPQTPAMGLSADGSGPGSLNDYLKSPDVDLDALLARTMDNNPLSLAFASPTAAVARSAPSPSPHVPHPRSTPSTGIETSPIPQPSARPPPHSISRTPGAAVSASGPARLNSPSGLSPSRLSPVLHAAANSVNGSGGRSTLSPLPSSPLASPNAVHAPTFYRQVKEVLSPDEFREFALQVHALNKQTQSPADTLVNVGKIFGENRPFLMSQMRRLVASAQQESKAGIHA